MLVTMRADLKNKIIISIAVVVPFLGVLMAIWLSWQRFVFASDILLLLGMYSLTALGVTIGYHRMLTHDGFKSSTPIRAIFLILGCMAFAGSRPDEWAATHIKHHAHSDEEGDPHSPLEGFWHSHMGWMFSLSSFADVQEYAPQLLKDPVVMFVSKTSLLWAILGFLIPFLTGGWTGLLWGGVVRLFVTTHATWSVNSVCHVFGSRAYETTDESRNEWIVGLIGFGEGWHNNHHAFPRNAFHGMRWWQFDLSGLIIRVMESFGLVWDVQRVSKDTAEAHRIHALTMQESLAQIRAQLSLKISNAQDELLTFLEKHSTHPAPDIRVSDMAASCQDAANRLQEIRENITRAAHLKKQRLLRYMHEVQEIADQAKVRIALATAQAVSS